MPICGLSTSKIWLQQNCPCYLMNLNLWCSSNVGMLMNTSEKCEKLFLFLVLMNAHPCLIPLEKHLFLLPLKTRAFCMCPFWKHAYISLWKHTCPSPFQSMPASIFLLKHVSLKNTCDLLPSKFFSFENIYIYLLSLKHLSCLKKVLNLNIFSFWKHASSPFEKCTFLFF